MLKATKSNMTTATDIVAALGRLREASRAWKAADAVATEAMHPLRPDYDALALASDRAWSELEAAASALPGVTLNDDGAASLTLTSAAGNSAYLSGYIAAMASALTPST